MIHCAIVGVARELKGAAQQAIHVHLFHDPGFVPRGKGWKGEVIWSLVCIRKARHKVNKERSLSKQVNMKRWSETKAVRRGYLVIS